ncbi:hypothetical protein [Novosphingobium sp. JCM 18896]|uniref:hypothetical protein n=1 Tax=Novosphingobium sp. JCM 18896 TaxID=2989731 RepID=UPI002222EDB4|nr:hypothetical protein [Novosphingobium sp. JCM 18896]MCW1430798.1 hypothetical protein [Novosphingobium sp. JCM 18896]
MPKVRQNLATDLLLRVLGLGLMAISGLAAAGLVAMVQTPPAHEGSPAEMGLAAVAFLGASAGVILSSLGAHIFDEVAISPRWALRPLPSDRAGRRPSRATAHR